MNNSTEPSARAGRGEGKPWKPPHTHTLQNRGQKISQGLWEDRQTLEGQKAGAGATEQASNIQTASAQKSTENDPQAEANTGSREKLP